MNALLKWKLAVYLLAIFAAGGVSGWVIGAKIAKNQMLVPPRPQDMTIDRVRHLQEKLSLSPEQTRKIETIFNQFSAEMQTRQSNHMVGVRQIVSNRNEKIIAILNPEQKDIFDKLEKERRELRNRARSRHGGGPGREKSNSPPTAVNSNACPK